MEPTQDLSLPESEPREICANCGKKMAKKGKFCPHCGQKRFATKVALKVVFKQFFYKLTNLDSKILRMIWRLLIPAQVTLDYFAGKIKQYPHPFQFFFVIMFFFLLAFNKVTDSGTQGIQFNIAGEDTKVPLNNNDPTKSHSQTKKQDLYFLLERYVFAQEILSGYDSLPTRLQTPDVKESLKIVVDTTNGHWTEGMDSLLKNEAFKDSLTLSFGVKRQRVALKDIVEYSPDEIVSRYGINNWFSKILIKQGIRSIQTPRELIAAYIGSFSWTILALILVMSVCLYLFYWRKKRYYVEHLVLLLHWHSGVLLVLTILMGVEMLIPLGTGWGFVGLAIFAFLWLTMWRFYQQNWFWTTLKWFGFMLIYSIGFSVFFVLGLVVVFAFF